MSVSTELSQFIEDAIVIDTHEHMRKENEWVEGGPRDVLEDLFRHYVNGDLACAGAPPQVMERLLDGADPDVEGRWAAIEPAWRAIQHTGYGETVRLKAAHVYGIDEITPAAMRAAQPRLEALRKPGQRLHLLRDLANLDHIQTDNGRRDVGPDGSGSDFFFYDISWLGFTYRGVDWALLESETGVTVKDLRTLQQAFEAIFERYGRFAIAVKTQHAYLRTLRWEKRDDADAERALQEMLKSIDDPDDATRLCIGDWCLARGAELCAEYGLPMKIHTGTYGGNNRLFTERIAAGHLCPLLIEYPETRFVLMHIAYPYSEELIALAKHFTNVWVDMCWAWSMSPQSSGDFLRRFLSAVPSNKLFAFGGDCSHPTTAYAYSLQMRRHLARTLRAAIDDGDMTESQAIDVAQRVLFNNQAACFDIEGTRAANLEMMETST